jgi:hypothetical protein
MRVVLLFIWTAWLPANAQYTVLTNNGAITISRYHGFDAVVSIPDTVNGLPVTSIGDTAFQTKYTVADVTIPHGVTNIGSSAFSGCSALTNIVIPDGLVSIGEAAFWSCGSLPSISIPASVTNIGEQALAYCTSLTAITVDALNPVYKSLEGVLFDQSFSKLIQCPGGKTGMYQVPGSVTNIGASAFRFCRSLTNVIMGNTIKTIGSEAFLSCSSLTNIAIPSSVTTIGQGAFESCSRLTTLTISNGVSTIERSAFSSCSTLTSVYLPRSVIAIGDFGFGNCTKLQSIEVAYDNPGYVSMGGVLFDRTTNTLVQFPAGKSGVYVIPVNVTNIGTGAFIGCGGLTSVTIPNGVNTIGTGAFAGCSSLTNIAIPDHVSMIGNNAFYSAARLVTVTFPRGLTNIGNYAFASCAGLTSVFFRGDAFPISSNVFLGNAKASMYYLPGTVGWDSTFGGRPALLWNPRPQIGDDLFGVRSNRFGFSIQGTANIPMVVEASTNLAAGGWIPLKSLSLTNGSVYFSDQQWTNHAARFYRIRSP